MACSNLTEGYSKLQCRDNTGGVFRVFIGEYDGDLVDDYTVTGGTVSIGTASQTYYTFEQEIETAEFNQNGQYSTENGTIFFEQTISLVFHKNDAAQRDRLLILSQKALSVLVEDQRGTYWLLGQQNGLRATAGAMMTGKAFGDLNGITITLTGKEPYPAAALDSSDSNWTFA